jgi:hypothetical protein
VRARVASAAVAGFETRLFLTANSGLVGCLGRSNVDLDRGIFPGSCPSKSPTSPDNQDVECALMSVCRQAASSRPTGFSGTWGAVPRTRCAGLGACEVRLLLLLVAFAAFGGPPLRSWVIASRMPPDRIAVSDAETMRQQRMEAIAGAGVAGSQGVSCHPPGTGAEVPLGGGNSKEALQPKTAHGPQSIAVQMTSGSQEA